MFDRHSGNNAAAYYNGVKDQFVDSLDQGLKFVLEHDKKPEIKLVIRRCRKADLEDILALQTKVYDAIPNKDTFVMTTEAELFESLDFDVCLGAYHYGILIAFTLMVVNPYSSRNLGLYLDYDQQQCAQCVTFDTTFVDPVYSGYGLQRVFLKLKEKIAISLGSAEALATVSPVNTYSLNNMRAGGFTVVDQKKMYGSFDRLILRKPLSFYKR